MQPSATTTRLASLTDAQRVYLRFVADGMTSKQIAHATGGSHHTINVQIGIAMRILGASSRQDAAAMLDDAGHSGSYDVSYEPDALARPVGDDEGPPDDRRSDGEHPWAIPIATTARPDNTLRTGQRLGWVLVIAAAVALLFGGLMSGIVTMLTSLGRLV